MNNNSFFTYQLPDNLEQLFFSLLNDFDREQIIFRLWAKDASLFNDQNEPLMLDWLDEPLLIKDALSSWLTIKQAIAAKDLKLIVLLGMGGASLSAKVFQSLLGPSVNKGLVIDTIHPSTIKRLTKHIDPLATLFLVASKSGTTLETHILFEYFFNKLSKANTPLPYQNFMAITDPYSPLAQLACDREFLACLLSKPGIGGRFSALSVFGLMPALLMDIDIMPLLASAAAMSYDCGPSIMAKNNPAALLAAFLGSCVKAGNQRLVIHLSASLKEFGPWLMQLIAESLGKQEFGMLPLIDETGAFTNLSSAGHVFIALTEQDHQLNKLRDILGPQASIINLFIHNKHDIGGLMYCFQMAVTLLAITFKINPFDQPDVQKTKSNTKEIMNNINIATDSSVNSLNTFLAQIKPNDYCAILSYLDETKDNLLALQALKDSITEDLTIPVLLQTGPQYLHSTGQLFKGGKNNGHFLVVTKDETNEQEFYILAKAHRAQAIADIIALRQNERNVYHLSLKDHNEIYQFIKLIHGI